MTDINLKRIHEISPGGKNVAAPKVNRKKWVSGENITRFCSFEYEWLPYFASIT